MSVVSEIIDKPLSREALGQRYRQLCADPRFANVPGKIELDTWGRIFMSPASNYHGVIQGRIVQRLAALPGQAMVETSVLTPVGLFVADVTWGSVLFIQQHQHETPFTKAPEICIEIASPSNSSKELREKIDGYRTPTAVYALHGDGGHPFVFRHGIVGRYELHRAKTVIVVDGNRVIDECTRH